MKNKYVEDLRGMSDAELRRTLTAERKRASRHGASMYTVAGYEAGRGYDAAEAARAVKWCESEMRRRGLTPPRARRR